MAISKSLVNYEANPNDIATSATVAPITKPTQGAACEGDTRVRSYSEEEPGLPSPCLRFAAKRGSSAVSSHISTVSDPAKFILLDSVLQWNGIEKFNVLIIRWRNGQYQLLNHRFHYRSVKIFIIWNNGMDGACGLHSPHL